MKKSWFGLNTIALLSVVLVGCPPAPPVVISLEGQFAAARAVKKCVPLEIVASVNYKGVDPGKVSFQYDFNDGSALENTRFEKIQKIFVREGEFNIKARVLIEGQEKPALENTLFVSVQSGVDCAYIVEVKAGGSVQKLKTATASILAATNGESLATFSNVLTGFVARYTPEQVDKIAARPDVESLTLSSALEFSAVQTNPNSWGLDRIDQREAPRDNSFSYTSIGRNTDIFILDTGVRATHSEFTGRVGTGYNVFTNNSDTTDSNGHGTHVAAIAAGATVGVARGARIIPVKVFPDKSAITEEWAFIKGLDWIAGNLNASRRAVVNLSAGLNSPSSLERKVDKAARNFARLNPNVLLVLAAGNQASSSSCSYSPARVTRNSSVISVGASGLSDERSVISNSGECVDLYAPGVEIRSASNTNDLDFQTKTGTSQAAPFVTGAAAAFLEANPTATAQMVKDALIVSSTKDKLSNAVPNRLLFLEQPIAVNVQPSGATIGVGESVEFNALVEGADNKSVTWEFTGAGGQSNGSKFSFSALQAGEFILTAISTADTTKRTSVRIVVEGGVLLNAPTSPMDTGSSQTLTARVVGLPNNAISWDVTPNTGNPLQNINGLTADFKPSVAGTYTVRVNSTSDPSKTASVQIRVSTAGSVAVSLDTSDFSLLVGSSKTIVATVSNAANGNVSWASSNPSIIGVSSSGLVSALGVGNATITATSVQDPSKSSSVNVISRDAVQVTPGNVSLGINENQVFNANVQGLGSTTVTWSISPGVGVSLSKGSSSAVFSANQIGVYTLTATSTADSSKKASVSITVFDSIAPTIALSASDIGVVVGSSSVLTAVAADNIGVSKVEFFEGNTKLGEDSSIPFQFSVGFPNVGSRAFTARAVDAQGNSASTNELFILASYRQSIQKNTIATGPYHSFAIKTDGTVLATGVNTWAALGDGTRINRASPTPVLNANNVVSIAAAGSLALKADGTLLAWGQNDIGQVGDGTTVDRLSPVDVLGVNNVVSIAVSNGHSLALKSNGTVLAWGDNRFGQLGDGTTTNRASPIVIPNLGNVIGIAAGKWYSLALKSDGTMISWGWNDKGQLGDGTFVTNSIIKPIPLVRNVIAVFAFEEHAVALKADGTLLSWGENSNSQLGDGTTINRSSPVPVLNATNIVSVAIGSRSIHNMALRSDGTVLAWGYNVTGQLGDNTTISRSTPVTVIQPGLTDVRALAVGERHTVALLGNGKLLSWGDNFYGQRGIADLPVGTQIKVDSPNTGSDTTPPSVSVAKSDIGVVLGSSATLSATASDNIGISKVEFYEGNTKLGEDTIAPFTQTVGFPAVGIRTFTARAFDPQGNSADSSQVNVLTSYKHFIQKRTIVAGAGTSFAIKTDGTMLSAGQNNLADLGDGTRTSRSAPTPILNAANVVSVFAERQSAILADGSVIGWGQNNVGQIGDGTQIDRLTVVPVLGLSNIVTISRNFGHGLALRSDGKVLAWGWNSDGQLGDGTQAEKLTPFVIPNLDQVIGIGGGYNTSFALKADGTLWAWGRNARGQLGDGTTTNRLTPTLISGATNVVGLVGHEMHTVALRSNGTLLAWGANDFGQVGDGTNTDRISPVAVLNATSIVGIGAGSRAYFSMALRNDGRLLSWGSNSHGQLGDGSTTNRNAPVLVTQTGVTNVVLVSVGESHAIALLDNGKLAAWGSSGDGQLGIANLPTNTFIRLP